MLRNPGAIQSRTPASISSRPATNEKISGRERPSIGTVVPHPENRYNCYFISVKFTWISVITSTGLPFNSVGRYFHWRTASEAAVTRRWSTN